jgi:hypothetical protein
MADITNFDPDDISNLRQALVIAANAMEDDGTDPDRIVDMRELESRMSRVIELTGEAF